MVGCQVGGFSDPGFDYESCTRSWVNIFVPQMVNWWFGLAARDSRGTSK